MNTSRLNLVGYGEPNLVALVQCGDDQWHVFTSEKVSPREGSWAATALALRSTSPHDGLLVARPDDEYSSSWFRVGNGQDAALENLLKRFAETVGDGVVTWKDGKREPFTRRSVSDT